jgi:hypothetical protein
MSKINFEELKKPFPAIDIDWRLQQCGNGKNGIWGQALAYVTNRAIMNRLDEVVGPENWKNEYLPGPDGGILCGLSIKIDGEWITKYDGADKTNIEAVKGGLSGAMKRAAVQWGIGRYLYQLETNWVTVSDNGKYHGKTKDNIPFRWDPPLLPKWALPSDSETPKTAKKNTANITELKLQLEGYINNGTLDSNKIWKDRALSVIKPECTDLEKIEACLTYCNSLSA